jgi:hypothetical protein
VWRRGELFLKTMQKDVNSIPSFLRTGTCITQNSLQNRYTSLSLPLLSLPLPPFSSLSPLSNFLKKKKASYILYYHSNSISKALVDLFPEIGIDLQIFGQCT